LLQVAKTKTLMSGRRREQHRCAAGAAPRVRLMPVSTL